METIEQKANFLRTELTWRLASIDPATKPQWGKMNVHQMIEHMGGAIQMASGALPGKGNTNASREHTTHAGFCAKRQTF